MRNTGLEETQAGIKIAGRNINSLKYAPIGVHQIYSSRAGWAHPGFYFGRRGLRLSISDKSPADTATAAAVPEATL